MDGKQARKVTWVLQLIKEHPRPSSKFFKKLVGTDLWGVRADIGGNAFRFIGFMDGDQLVILTSGFAKKTQKTPKQEIETALERRKDYFNRKKGEDMDDLQKDIAERKERDPAFAEGYDSGYREFLVGILLREARERAGVTQEELADAIHTKKSVISRLENKASDARVSTLRKVAQALDKELVIELRDRPKQHKRREKVTA